jgi:hypothetical protein
MLTDVSARFDDQLLEFTVDHFIEALDEQTFVILSEDRIPIGSPDYLDDVPACSSERGFELLDNLSIAA